MYKRICTKGYFEKHYKPLFFEKKKPGIIIFPANDNLSYHMCNMIRINFGSNSYIPIILEISPMKFPEICEEFNVDKFPTVIVLKDGEEIKRSNALSMSLIHTNLMLLNRNIKV